MKARTAKNRCHTISERSLVQLSLSTHFQNHYVSPLQGRETYCFSPGVRLSVRPSVCPSVCLSVTNRVRSITWKPLKLYSRNFIQISISMRWRAECMNGNSAFYTFGVISLWIWASQNRVRSITWKPLKVYSRNFIQISISIRWRAECKNWNSAFYTFGVISLWTLCITKIVSALLLENRLRYIHEFLYKHQSA